MYKLAKRCDRGQAEAGRRASVSGEGRAGLEGRLLGSCGDGPNGGGHAVELLLSLGTKVSFYCV